MIQAADVTKLKCTYFNAVRMMVELDWYGIECGYESNLKDVEQAFFYLQIVDTGCELTYEQECKILAFIKAKYGFCTRMFDPCDSRVTIDSGLPD